MKGKIIAAYLVCTTTGISFAQTAISSAKKVEELKIEPKAQPESADTIQEFYSNSKTVSIQKPPVQTEAKPEETPQEPVLFSREKMKIKP